MGCARLYRFDLPYTPAELPAIDYEQSADIMYLAHPSHDPSKLSRYGHTDWRLAAVTFGSTIAAPGSVTAGATTPSTGTGYTPATINYVVTAIQTDNGQESLPSAIASTYNDLTLDGNYNTINWAPVTGSDRYQVYKEENGIFGYIGGTVDTSFKDDNIAADLGQTPPGNRQPFATANNKPGKVTFYQQRLVWGRTNLKPNGVFTSQSGNFENLNVASPARADDAITFALVARQVNAITHMVPLKSLILLTTDAIFAIDGGQQGFISPSALNDTPQGYRGASEVRPAVVDDIVFFNTAKGAAVRTLGYQFQVDGYKGNDITVFAPHFFKGFTLVDMAWCESPMSTLWCLRSDGKLLALTWQAEQDVWGWSLCDTDGFVESIASVTESGEDRLYIIVRRTIGGVDKRYIERAASYLWAATDDASDDAKALAARAANFLDSSLTYAGDPIQVAHGLGHLEGRTVTALADGNVISNLTVVDGMVDLGAAFSTIIIGLPYRSWIKTLPPVATTQSSIIGLTQQITDIVIRVEQSRGLVFGYDETATDDLFPIKMRMDEGYGEATHLFSGDIRESMPSAWSSDPAVVIIQDHPLPMTVLGVFPDLDVGG